MEKIKLVLVIKDIFYLNKLKTYILKHYSQVFQLVCISKLAVLKEIEKHKGILLLDEDFYTKNIDTSRFDNLIILSDNLKLGERGGFKILNKYVSANILCDEVISIYQNKKSEENSDDIEKRLGTKVSMVFSPVGRSGSSSIASSIAILYAKLGKKVLYINLENLKTTGYFFKVRQYGDISFRENETLKFLPKIQSNLMKDEITGVYCFDYDIDRKEDVLEFGDILKFIVTQNIFALIIVDMDSNLNQINRSILNLSENVLVPVLLEDISLFKIKKYLERYGLARKINFILNKTNESLVNEKTRNINFEVGGIINFDENIENGRYQNLYESTSFMYDINKVIKDIIE